jgi:hypothetical protein
MTPGTAASMPTPEPKPIPNATPLSNTAPSALPTSTRPADHPTPPTDMPPPRSTVRPNHPYRLPAPSRSRSKPNSLPRHNWPRTNTSEHSVWPSRATGRRRSPALTRHYRLTPSFIKHA